MGFMANHSRLQLQLTPIKVIMHHTFPAHFGSTLCLSSPSQAYILTPWEESINNF